MPKTYFLKGCAYISSRSTHVTPVTLTTLTEFKENIGEVGDSVMSYACRSRTHVTLTSKAASEAFEAKLCFSPVSIGHGVYTCTRDNSCKRNRC